MKRDFKLYLKDIIECVNSIEEFIGDLDLDEFIEDDKTNSAVVRKVEVIGEASKNIPLEIKKRYPNIDWSDMAKTRDKIIHLYFGVDFKIVWNVVKEKLPQLREDIAKILSDLEQQKTK